MKKIVANLIDTEEMRIAVLDDKDRLCDFFIERGTDGQRTGEIYKAKIDNVIAGINAAFVNLGNDRNGFLYLADARGMDIKAGMDVTVQLVKNARKGKCARVTSKISLAGRYLVLVPNGRHTGISKKIEDAEERNRLRDIIKSCQPENFGVIIRTAAVGISEDALRADIQEMLERWEKIKKYAAESEAPCLVHKEAGLLERVLRDELTNEIDEIIVDTPEDYETAKKFTEQFMQGAGIEVTCYEGSLPLFDVYGIENQLSALQERKVWLSSGAYLVIDQTEALTVIDVNTGKFTGSKDLEDTVFKTNMEAAAEVARQLRLRALGGIVIIDFIDMAGDEHNRQLVKELEAQLKGDKCKARVFGVTGLGLVQITRKRSRRDFRSEIMRGCPFCQGLGAVEKEDVIALRIKRFIRKICANTKAEALLIECFSDIASYIEGNMLSAWEEEFEIKILLHGSREFAWAKYRLDFQGSCAEAEKRLKELSQPAFYTA